MGYDVRPSMRQRGYGTAVLRLVLPLVRQHDIERVHITYDADNIGSIKIIECNGGVLDSEEISPNSGKLIRQYWIDP